MDANTIERNESQMLKAREVAKRLNISRSLAYQLMTIGEIPTVRFNRSVRVRASDLDEFIIRSWSGWREG
jgi:excisionase family DNA binding protein